ncbi:MAG: excinuclease ABC subunit C [Elusimicrobia bacterium CG_4_9_14_3_um_filter_62_55]|nr:MAG: excinuclease ABC subunit C [Elusimicrobia bacterium CG22_combo_CG10-13_8_21_14_all_63_91]PJA16439.1 MAG: excinuclease ABC subunit C [Elusimicrobia bacterium CG_4_10_14_0_2_um_filter_63_34]PJB25685.1 MAG: excinuclease ABC subunit C [Elusimicrobia bacterium CG_4_9_14_3_um_filter_62_55]
MDSPSPDRTHLPHAPGVYLMRDASLEVLYVGKAKDLHKRVSQYFNPNRPDPKTQQLVPLIRKIDYIACESEREALIWERRLIHRHQPFFNVLWKDDKSYPFVKLSLDEEFPRLRVVRVKKRDGAKYFGPYPKITPVRSLLRGLWKRQLFPLRPCDFSFSSQKPLAPAKIKSCLYYHTGECPAPCAGKISTPAYRRIAENAALFFEGRYARLKRAFQTQMRAASKKLDYERSAQLRDNVEALEHMGERVRYREVRPGRVAQRLDESSAVTELQKALSLPHPPHRIECFDISHLFGKEPVASMVAFAGGRPDKSSYRRFRVRTVTGIDDFASMAEVVGRRYKRLLDEQTPLPDLVLVDGGKGQLEAARKALDAVRAKIPLASLAKREEEVFLVGRKDSIRLPADSPALHLLQRLRDEAHRFAVTFTRKNRTKRLLR